jgi:hypothetical protein
MKKSLFTCLIVLSVVLTAVACSKKKRIQKNFRGNWTAAIIDDVTVPTGTSVLYTLYQKTNTEGTGKVRTALADSTYDSTSFFTYTISKDVVTFTFPIVFPDTSWIETYMYNITECNADKMVMMSNIDNTKTVWVPTRN